MEPTAELTRLIAHIQAAARHTLLEEVGKGDRPPSFEQFRDQYAGILLSEALVVLTMKNWEETAPGSDPATARAALVRLAERLGRIATSLDETGDYVVAVLRKDKAT